LKLSERHGQADANALEIAAGYAPTIGILGTVVGLIEVLRNFSDVRSIGPGIGAAFVSTIYGLAAANFLLLPLAHRIHARVAEATETQEMIAEGVLCVFASIHPSIVRQRLAPYLRESAERSRVLNFRRRVEVINPHDSVS
jgi:chemotaxis protein MotA